MWIVPGPSATASSIQLMTQFLFLMLNLRVTLGVRIQSRNDQYQSGSFFPPNCACDADIRECMEVGPLPLVLTNEDFSPL